VQEKTFTEKEITDLNENYTENFEGIESPEGEIWIGKRDLLPYKIIVNMTKKETEKSKTSGVTNLTLLLKNFNKPVQIDAPQESKSLEELFGGSLGLGETTPLLNQ
jgi:hypothetical protein